MCVCVCRDNVTYSVNEDCVFVSVSHSQCFFCFFSFFMVRIFDIRPQSNEMQFHLYPISVQLSSY